MVDYIIQLSNNFIISYLDKVVNTKQDVIKIPYLSLRTITDYLSYKSWKISIRNRDNEIIELTSKYNETKKNLDKYQQIITNNNRTITDLNYKINYG